MLFELTAWVSLFATNGYVRPELLIEPAEVRVRSDVIVLDAREEAKFKQRHAPRARWVDAAEWAKQFNDGKDPDGWSKRVGALGINANANVVVYDDAKSRDACRIWWILRYWGVKDVRVMNGGWRQWTAGKHPEETTPLDFPTAQFVAKPATSRLSTKGDVLDAIAKSSCQVVDARSGGEFCGTDILKNRRGGAVPGAKHLEWSDLIDSETHRFKTPPELRKLFADAGIDPKKQTVTYCQSGGRAAVMAFALELMGGDGIRNYHASWSEWGNADDTPVEPGKKK